MDISSGFNLWYLFCSCIALLVLGSNSIWALGLTGQQSKNAPASFPKSNNKATWMERVYQLVEYRNMYGDTLVPKRYPENPALGNWVSKQRQQYRKFCSKESCSLTAEQVDVLNQIEFCWNATLSQPSSSQSSTDLWWERYEELKGYSSIWDNLPSSLERFLQDQRREYRKVNDRGQIPSSLNKKKILALSEIDPNWWKTASERRWDNRYDELKNYKSEYGDCCVPISFHNRKLAHWVSNLRKRYKQRQCGTTSTLTQEQIDQLNEIGFVWNRWDYEFSSKMKKDTA